MLSPSGLWDPFAKKSKLTTTFKYLEGREHRDLCAEVLERWSALKAQDPDTAWGLQSDALHLLEQAVRTAPAPLCCGSPMPLPKSSMLTPCCLAHTVQLWDMKNWRQCCSQLEKAKVEGLAAKPSDNMSPSEVLRRLRQAAAGGSDQEIEALDWLETVLYATCNMTTLSSDPVVRDVVRAAKLYRSISEGKKTFRPVQLAAILLMVRSSSSPSLSTSTLIEMLTGEGKTDVCAAIAGILAKRDPEVAVHIITSSSDRAAEDRHSSKHFIKALTGKDPILASQGLKWGPEGCGVVYAQVSDIQKMVVEEMQKGEDHNEMFDWLRKCYLIVDEADHVLIEQSEHQLYISALCRAFQALAPLLFLAVGRMDFDADFFKARVKDVSAVPEKAAALSKKLSDDVRRHVGRGRNGHWALIAPAKVDLEACTARIASGSLGARQKSEDKDFVIEVGDCHGVKALIVVIYDASNGTESYGTRWTSEAPAVEALSGLPMGGSEPLAYFNSIATLARIYTWFGGVTGTLGQDHCLDFIADVYNARTVFRMPRNVGSAVHQLKPCIAKSEMEWFENIIDSAEKYVEERHELPVTGPVLIIVPSIEKAKKLVERLRERGHAIMDEDDGTWSGTPMLGRAHLFPFFRGEHSVMERLPAASIVVATNKGGRGLDLKLDGQCPSTFCPCRGKFMSFGGSAGRVLFVILTEVLPQRQDAQARGRCGRGGKAGVVQYCLLDKAASLFEEANNTVRLVELQNTKDEHEEGDLLSKAKRVEESIKDGRLLKAFVDWKPGYLVDWMRQLFPNTASECGSLQVRQAFAAFIDNLLVERWAYWRTRGEPGRRPGDLLYHFRHSSGLKDVMRMSPPRTPAEGQATTKKHVLSGQMKQFLQRVWNFAAATKLDSEQLFELSRQLIGLGSESSSFIIMAECILEQAAIKKDCPWKLCGEAPWELEWTGNAALVLASLRQRLGRGQASVLQALTASAERVEAVMQSLRLSSGSDCQLFSLAAAAQHRFPGKVLQQGKVVRQQESKYLVQFRAMLNHLEHRKECISNLSGQPIHLTHISEIEGANLQHLYLLGYPWYTTVFEFLPQRSIPQMSPPLEGWLKDLEKAARDRGEELPCTNASEGVCGNGGQTVKKSSKKRAGGGGGGGDSTQINQETAHSQRQKEGQDLANSLNTLNLASEACSQEHVKDLHSLRPSQAAVKHGQTSAVWTWLVGTLQKVLNWLRGGKVLFGKRNTHKQSSGLLLQADLSPLGASVVLSAAATATLAAARQSRRASCHKATREAARRQQADDTEATRTTSVHSFERELLDTLQPLMQNFGNVSNVTERHRECTDLNDHSSYTVNHDGRCRNSMKYTEVRQEAQEAIKDPIHATPEGMSKEEDYISQALLLGIMQKVQAGELQQFGPMMVRFQEALRDYNEAVQGGHVNVQQARDAKAMYSEILRTALDLAKSHGEDLVTILGDSYRTAWENYRGATAGTMQERFDNVVEKVEETVGHWEERVSSWFGRLFAKVKSAWTRVTSKVAKVVNRVVKRIERVIQPITSVMWAGLEKLFGQERAAAAWSFVKNLVGNAALAAVNAVTGGLGAIFMGTVWAARKVVQMAWKFGVQLVQWAGKALALLWEKVQPFLMQCLETLYVIFEDTVERVQPALQFLGNLRMWVGNKWQKFTETRFGEWFHQATQKVVKTFDAFVVRVIRPEFWNRVAARCRVAFGTLVGALTTFCVWFANTRVGIALRAAFLRAWAFGTKCFQHAKNFAANLWDTFINSHFVKTLLDVWSSISTFAIGLWSRLKDFVSGSQFFQVCWAKLCQWADCVFDQVLAPLATALAAFGVQCLDFAKGIWKPIVVFFRARADIDRFAQWGNMEAFGGAGNSFLLFDAERHQAGISAAELRRREALQAVWQAGFLQWWTNPSLALRLDASDLPDDVQQRQERANEEYAQASQDWWSKLAFAGCMFGAVFALVMLVLSVWTGGLTAVASFAFAVQLLNVVAALSMVCVMRRQMTLQSDSTLSQEEKEELQNWLTVAQNVLMVVTFALCGLETFFGLGSSAVALGVGMASSAMAMGFQRFMLLLRQLMHWVQLPNRLRSLWSTVDRLLALLGLNGAGLAQFGLTSISRVLSFLSELTTALLTLLTAFLLWLLNLFRRQVQSLSQAEEELEEESSSVSSCRKTIKKGVRLPDGTVIVHTEAEATVKSEEVFDDDGPPDARHCKGQDASLQIRLANHSDPATVRFEKNGDGQEVMVADRDLTQEEAKFLAKVKTPKDLKNLFDESSKRIGSQQFDVSKVDSVAGVKDGQSYCRDCLDDGKDRWKFQEKGNQQKGEIATGQQKVSLCIDGDADHAKITGGKVTRPLALALFRLCRVGDSGVRIDEKGTVSLEEWGQDLPEPLAGVTKGPNSKAWGRVLQAVLYSKLRRAGKGRAEALKAIEGAAGLVAVKEMLRNIGREFDNSPESQRARVDLVQRLGFDKKEVRINDGQMQPVGIRWAPTSKDASGDLQTIAYLETRKEGLSHEKAKEVAESDEMVEAVQKRLRRHGQQDMARLKEATSIKRPQFSEKTKRLYKRIAARMGVEEAHVAHQLSWDSMEEKVTDLVRKGDQDGLSQFVCQFLEKANSMTEQLRNHPDLAADWKDLQEEQGQRIAEALLSLGEAMNGASRGRVQERMQDLLDGMNEYVGNLQPGHGTTNQSIGKNHDLQVDAGGKLTPRSRWIADTFPHALARDASGRVRSSIVNPKTGSTIIFERQ